MCPPCVVELDKHEHAILFSKSCPMLRIVKQITTTHCKTSLRVNILNTVI